MTMLLVPPPPLPPAPEDAPQDIELDFDFHIDFSLDPLPCFSPPPSLGCPASDRDCYRSRIVSTGPFLPSNTSSRASVLSLESAPDDPQSSAFWGSFGTSAPFTDQHSEMTAPLNIVKRDRVLSKLGNGHRSAIYGAELEIPGLNSAHSSHHSVTDRSESGSHSSRCMGGESPAPSHSVSVPHSPTTSACDHDFKSIPMPTYHRTGRKISLHISDKSEPSEPPPDHALGKDTFMKYPPFPVDVNPDSDDELPITRWGGEPPEMWRDSGHSSDDGPVPATPRMIPTRLPPTRPPRPPSSLCPPVNGQPLPYWPEEQLGQDGYLSLCSGTQSQRLDEISPCAPPRLPQGMDVRCHSALPPRDSTCGASYKSEVTSEHDRSHNGGVGSESTNMWRPARDPAYWKSQREPAYSSSLSTSPFSVGKLNPRSAVGKDGEQDASSELFSDSDDEDFSPTTRALGTRSPAARRRSVPESPTAFDIPAKAASILGLGDGAPESPRKTKRGGLLGDIGSKGLLARRRNGLAISSSSSMLRGHMRKRAEFDPIGIVKGETREAHIDRNGDLWVNVSAEAKKRPESTRSIKESIMSRPSSTKGLPSLPQLPTDVDVAEHVELYNALKTRALPPTPESPRSGSFLLHSSTSSLGHGTPTTRRGRPGSALFSPLMMGRSSSQGSAIVPPSIRETPPRAPPRGPLPPRPTPPSPPRSPLFSSSRRGSSPAPGTAQSHERSQSSNTVASADREHMTNLTHVQTKRDTLIPYFPPEQQLVRYVPPPSISLARPLSHTQQRTQPVAVRTPQSQSLYETSARIQHPYGAISDATRDELVAALRNGDLTAEQTALLESSVTALLTPASAVEPDVLAFPTPPLRIDGELLHPENALNETKVPSSYPRASYPRADLPRPPSQRIDTLQHRRSKGMSRSNVPAPIEIISRSELDSEVESARDDGSDVDPAPPFATEISEWEPDTPSSAKTRLPEFLKRLNSKKEAV